MEIVILLGGGDGGVLVITSHGIRRIPPFNPDVIRELKAVNNLIRVEGGGEAKDVAARLSSSALAHVAKATGLTGASLLFEDGDDVLHCGNNGPHVIPRPHAEAA